MACVVSLGKTLYTNFLVLSETDVKPGGPVFMNFMFTLKSRQAMTNHRVLICLKPRHVWAATSQKWDMPENLFIWGKKLLIAGYHEVGIEVMK